jgi:6-phosphogluconolactonase
MLPVAFSPGATADSWELRKRIHSPHVIPARAPRPKAVVMLSTPRRLTVGAVPALLADRVVDRARAALAARGEFTIALSGGSLPRQLAEGLDADKLAAAEPERWTVLLADERRVPLDDADSNYRLIREMMPFLKEERIVAIYPSLSAAECAADYSEKVKKALSGSEGVFDLVLLGLGPDGHTASLFPGHSLLDERDLAVASVTDSPKPPPERVTLTLPIINGSRAVAFACTGAGKADAIKDIFENPSSALPGALVAPSSGELDWYIDAAAAGGLK